MGFIGFGIGFGVFKGSGKGVAPPFSPTNISGLQLWLDASDETTITEASGAVSQWDDKSGNDRHATQATGVRQPTTGTQTINGLNVIDFNADFMTNPAYTARTFFFVTNDANGSVNSGGGAAQDNICPLIGSNVGENNQYMFIRTNIVDYDFSVDGIGTSTGDTGTLNVDTGASGTGGNIDASMTSLEKSGSRIWAVRGNQNYVNMTYVAFLDVLTSTYTANIEIAEILAYDGVLTTSEINQIGDYLGEKWNIPWTDL